MHLPVFWSLSPLLLLSLSLSLRHSILLMFNSSRFSIILPPLSAALSGNKQWVFDVNNLMRVLQMPALGITHAAHSAVIKTPDFPQDSSPCLADKKVTHTCRNFSLFTSGEEDYIFRQAKWDNDNSKQWRETREKDRKKEKGWGK